MATSKQEQLYNEIVEYYAYADRLIGAVEDSTHKLAEQQFAIVEDVATSLEVCADKLTTQYIDFVKTGQPDKVIEEVRKSLNAIASKIEECRNKILILYQESDENHKTIL
jgi:hypothetical protein